MEVRRKDMYYGQTILYNVLLNTMYDSYIVHRHIKSTYQLWRTFCFNMCIAERFMTENKNTVIQKKKCILRPFSKVL